MNASAKLLLGFLLLCAIILAFTLKQPDSCHSYLYNPYAIGYTCSTPEIGNLRVLPIGGSNLRYAVAGK